MKNTRKGGAGIVQADLQNAKMPDNLSSAPEAEAVLASPG
jgi:hypothetical protein